MLWVAVVLLTWLLVSFAVCWLWGTLARFPEMATKNDSETTEMPHGRRKLISSHGESEKAATEQSEQETIVSTSGGLPTTGSHPAGRPG